MPDPRRASRHTAGANHYRPGMRRLRPILGLLALGAVGFAAASTWAHASATPTAVRVVARDFSYALSRSTVPVGRVRFTVVNRGAVSHDFQIAGRKTTLLRPGHSAVLLVTFTRAGRFPYRCTVPGHAALGMKGVLTVGKPAVSVSTAQGTTTGTTGTTPPPTTTGGATGVKLTKIGDFQRPVAVTAPRGDPNHLFVAEQQGTVQEVVDGQVLAAPFLDVTDQVKEVSERGFLGLAFAPDYAKSGRLYVDFTDRTGNGNINVVEYRRSAANPDQADPATARPILQIVKPWENHNAGMLQFGPDGYLYIAVGDGDSGVLHPPGTFAQTLDDLLGNILRIDPLHPTTDSPYSVPDTNPFVGRDGARPEIWDYGFRNPWRFTIDPVTGDLYVGDVGEGAREEIDYVEGNSGGLNFGWPCFEGTVAHPTTQTCAGAIPPVYDYDHGGGRCAVIGGVVVRDPRLPGLAGKYLFGDYCDGKLHSVTVADGKAGTVADLGLSVPTLDSFGVDGRGRIYVTATDGGLYRLDPA
jgi:glucose/arabinose dehydrogenase